jgi:hypothetical protein
MSIAQMEALYSTAASALDSGDYAAAIVAATKAQLLLPLSPDRTQSGGSRGGNEISWRNDDQIKEFIANCRRLQSTAAVTSGGVFAQSKVTYARPSDG